jgi:hypothetical protein
MAPSARKVLGRPRRCKLAHAFVWEYSYKRAGVGPTSGPTWRRSHLLRLGLLSPGRVDRLDVRGPRRPHAAPPSHSHGVPAGGGAEWPRGPRLRSPARGRRPRAPPPPRSGGPRHGWWWSHLCAALYISWVVLYKKYTGWCTNESTAVARRASAEKIMKAERARSNAASG